MFFYKQMYIETINGGKKSRKFFFQKHTYIARKNDGKNRLEKVRKHVFYENTNIVTKKWGGGKREKNFFQKHTYIASFKRWKKIV